MREEEEGRETGAGEKRRERDKRSRGVGGYLGSCSSCNPRITLFQQE